MGRGLALAHLQDANLTKRSLADLLIFVRLLELLDCDDLSGLLVACLEDNAVRSARQTQTSSATLVRDVGGVARGSEREAESARTPRRSYPTHRNSP